VTAVQQVTWEPATRGAIAQQIAQDLAMPALLAAIGTAALVLRPERQPAAMLNRRQTYGLALLLWSAALVFPSYHLLTSNIRSLDKHMAYALVFLAPLAGWGIYQALDFTQHQVRSPLARALFTGVIILGLVGVFGAQIDQGTRLTHTWSNKQATFDYLASQPINSNTPILAEGSDVYTLHFNWDTRVPIVGTFSSGFQYDQQYGDAAMKAAVTNHYFQYLILDDYYTPVLSNALKQAAQAAGYQRVFYHSDPLSSGQSVLTEIYALSPAQGAPASP
jgi:hypothetical protein